MSDADRLVITQMLLQVPMPVFCCDLSPHLPALQLAREAIDELRAIDPTPIASNVRSTYVSPWDSHARTPKFQPLCDLILAIGRYVSQTFLSSNLAAINLDLFVKDCWGMVYETSDHTIRHNHYPAELSCAIYLEADPDCAPICFDNGFQIQPTRNLLVMFPGVLNHEVPATQGRRVVVSMNLFKCAKLPAPGA
ncbi:MAG: hypothetical protein RLZZ142_2042 [Verrucomicrobiota bacterium]